METDPSDIDQTVNRLEDILCVGVVDNVCMEKKGKILY